MKLKYTVGLPREHRSNYIDVVAEDYEPTEKVILEYWRIKEPDFDISNIDKQKFDTAKIMDVNLADEQSEENTNS